MARKTILDNWLDDVKRRNLNYTDLRREIINISDSHNSRYRTIYLKLNGSNAPTKASNLIEQWRTGIPVTNTTEVEEKDDYLYDSNCVVPIGCIIDLTYDKYKLLSIDYKNNNTQIIHYESRGKLINNATKQSYPLNTLNNNIKTNNWKIDDHSKKVQAWIKNFKFPPNIVTKEQFKREGNSSMQFTGLLPVNNSTIYLNTSATANCQLSVMGAANAMLTSCTNDEVTQQLREVKKLSGKRLLLMDLQTNYIKQLKEKVPEKHIVNITPYTSTNGSSMNLVLLNIDTI